MKIASISPQAAQVLGLGKVLLIMFVLGSLNPFQFLGQPTPGECSHETEISAFENASELQCMSVLVIIAGWYSWLIENKMYACLMIFFLANAVETQLISTGAFEVSYFHSTSSFKWISDFVV